MKKAAPWLLVALGLTVSSRVQAQAFWTTLGVPLPNGLGMVSPSAPSPSFRVITGLQPSELSLGIALRPATAELYMVGSSGRLYRLDPTTAAATQVGAPFVPALNGTEFGIGFDNSDHLRVVGGSGQNLQIDPTTGAVTVNAPLAFAAGDPNTGQTPQVGVIAFDPYHGGDTAYAVDDHFGLVRLGSTTASDGTLTTIAPLSGVGTLVGLAISRTTGAAFGLEPGYNSYLTTVDLTTGAASELNRVGGQFVSFRGLSQAPTDPAIPTLSGEGLAVLALGLALSSLLLLRKRLTLRTAPSPSPSSPAGPSTRD
jgi:hypothetical protein